MQLPQDVTIPLLVGGDRPSVLVLEPLRTEKPLPAVEGDQAGDLCSHSPCLTDFFHLSLAPEHVVLSLDLAVEVKMSLICKPDVADPVLAPILLFANPFTYVHPSLLILLAELLHFSYPAWEETELLPEDDAEAAT